MQVMKKIFMRPKRMNYVAMRKTKRQKEKKKKVRSRKKIMNIEMNTQRARRLHLCLSVRTVDGISYRSLLNDISRYAPRYFCRSEKLLILQRRESVRSLNFLN